MFHVPSVIPTITAAYNARCWAMGKSEAEIRAEIQRCKEPRNYAWNEVGNATATYRREMTLEAILRGDVAATPSGEKE